MGYYTYYEIANDDEQEDDYIPELSAISGYSHEDGESIKWYDHDEDMYKLSRRHPEVTFRVQGSGEENGDVWVKWYRNGKQREWHLDVVIPKGFDPPGGW